MPTLFDLIDIEAMRQIVSSFSAVTGVAIDVLDPWGQPVIEQEPRYEFCRRIRTSKLGLQRCIDSNPVLHGRTTSQPYIGLCHAQVGIIAVPIKVADELLGSVACSQVHLQQPDHNTVKVMMKATADLPVEKHDLTEMFLDIEVCPEEKSKATVEFIGLVANYISEAGYRFQGQLEANRRRIELIQAERARIDLEKSLAEAELKSLQAQMHPHFLFNALNVISRMVMLGRYQETEDTIYALSDLLRYTFDNSRSLVRLGEEFGCVENYLKVQQARFYDRLEYVVMVSDRARECLVPPFLLQPLVENAVVHGVADLAQRSKIIVIGQVCDDDMIVVTVADNGRGMSECELFEAKDGSKGFALRSIMRRLELQYGGRAELVIDSKQGKGSCVRLVMPMVPLRGDGNGIDTAGGR